MFCYGNRCCVSAALCRWRVSPFGVGKKRKIEMLYVFCEIWWVAWPYWGKAKIPKNDLEECESDRITENRFSLSASLLLLFSFSFFLSVLLSVIEKDSFSLFLSLFLFFSLRAPLSPPSQTSEQKLIPTHFNHYNKVRLKRYTHNTI